MLPRARPFQSPVSLSLSPFFRPPRNHRLFSTTRHHAAREPTYYEILNIPITASTSEIKKQFYTLSLKHHPDRNRSHKRGINTQSDKSASSEIFAQISSAYSVLGDTTKRAVYDRDTGISAQRAASSHPGGGGAQGGSYSSYSSSNVYNKGGSYAGSRPASGLSKRRGPFRGPPPSFYAHGGFARSGRSPGSYGGGATGKWKEEDDPESFIDRNPVSHFNARGHYKTQSAEDIRRQARRMKAMGDAFRDHQVGKSGDTLVRFIIVCGILVGTWFIPGMFWSGSKGGKYDPALEESIRRKREG